MEQKRGALARIGITLLNILAPGLGLLRLGRWGPAAIAYGLGLLALTFIYAAPPVGFAIFASAMLVGLAAYPISMVVTWLHSREIGNFRPWYARWYSIVGAMLLAFGISFLLTDERQQRYRSFYTPAEGMVPTLPKGDRFFAYMRAPRDLRRGQLLMVRAPDGSTYVKRLVGLPGDEISLTNGVVQINGRSVAQRAVGSETIKDHGGSAVVRRMSEQFPGETGVHEIYDQGRSAGDDFGPIRVRSGYVFVLGDNRDRSADSRFSHEEMGLGQVAIADILGWPLFHSFRSSRTMGQAINWEGTK